MVKETVQNENSWYMWCLIYFLENSKICLNDFVTNQLGVVLLTKLNPTLSEI
jgi:hypothetical protein